MDADAAHLRMKWIMAIESFVLDLSPSGQSSSDLIGAVGLGNTVGGENNEEDDDDEPMFAALSTQKLSPAEIEIMHTINKFTGCWMTDDEENYNKVVTAGKICC